MPKLMPDDNRYTLFCEQRRSVLAAARHLLRELKKIKRPDDNLKYYITQVEEYMFNYTIHPQININFLNFLNGRFPYGPYSRSIPEFALEHLKKSLANDQEQMSQRNCSYVIKRNDFLNISAWFTCFVGISFCPDFENKRNANRFLLLVVALTAIQLLLKVKNSVADWDYLDQSVCKEEAQEPLPISSQP